MSFQNRIQNLLRATVSSKNRVKRAQNHEFQLEALEGRLLMTAAPVAADDNYAAGEEEELVVDVAEGVLANDTDDDGDDLTAVLIDGPANGTLTLNEDGSFNYLPNVDFSGDDTFTYVARSFVGASGFQLDPVESRVDVQVNYEGGEEFREVSIEGVMAADLSPETAPFTDVEITQVFFTVQDAMFLSLGPFFDVPVSTYDFTQDGAVMLELSNSGGSAAITDGDFNQTGNTLDFSGKFNVDRNFDGGTDFDIESSGTSDFTGTLTQIDNEQRLSLDIDYTTSFMLDGSQMTIRFFGTLVAQGAFVTVAEDSEPATVTISVADVNDPPVAVIDSYRTEIDTPLVVDAVNGILANDIDEDLENITIDHLVQSGPSNGTLELNQDGSFTYTPNPGFEGTDNFRYYLHDGEFQSATPATVSIRVKDRPVGVEDSYNATEDFVSAVNVDEGLLANDIFDMTLNNVTVSVVDAPANGTLNLADDGSFSYTPNLDFSGVDTFTYALNDGLDTTDPVTVTINVASAPDPIRAFDDFYVMNKNEFLATGANLGTTSSQLVSFGSIWNYSDIGFDYGTDWRETDFDDSNWSSGRAILGYGDGVETTTLTFGGDAGNKIPTYYFRQEFNLDDISAIDTLLLQVVRDDAAAVFINGIEVYRDANLIEDAFFSDYARSAVAVEDEISIAAIPVTQDMLNEGRNVISAEVHQATPGSSDLRFDLALSVMSVGVLANDYDPDGDPIVATITDPPNNGILEFNEDGSFNYYPSTNFSGVDTFTYRVKNEGAPDTPPPVGNLPDFGSTWRYLDDGSNQGIAWREIDFDDSGWAQGAGELGYGDNDEQTVVSFGADDQNKFPTTYFRHDFQVSFPENAEAVQITLRRDDGAAVYLNGTEVYRDANLPFGATYLTNTTSTGPENGEVQFLINPALLIDGENVLAVEVHQASATSSDISFDLKMESITNFERTATILVGEQDILPVVGEDQYVVERDKTTRVFAAGGVLANDVDEDDTLVALLDLPPSNGRIVFNADGSFDYTPTPGFVGVDAFTYLVFPDDVNLGTTDFITAGSNWDYLNDGSDPGVNWTQSFYDDSTWLNGTAPLGYAVNGVTTDVRIDLATRFPAYFYRNTFNVPDASIFDIIQLGLRFDDGIAVYLNGQEISRVNLASDAAYDDLATTRASTIQSGGITNIQINKSALISGTNTIAVEVHDESRRLRGSIFDLTLQGLTIGNRAEIVGGQARINVVPNLDPPLIPGDLNKDNRVDAADIDFMNAGLNAGLQGNILDVNENGDVDITDRDFLIRNILNSEYGDINLDGQVDLVDLSLLTPRFGDSVSGWANGDINGNGIINIEDLALLSTYFGQSATPPAPQPILSAPQGGTPANNTGDDNTEGEALFLNPSASSSALDLNNDDWDHIHSIL